MNKLAYEIKFHNLWESINQLDKPEEYIEKLPDELYNLLIDELSLLAEDPFNCKKLIFDTLHGMDFILGTQMRILN